MAVSLRESVEQVSDPRNLDASVDEVFRLMLGVECRRDKSMPSLDSGIGDRGRGVWRGAEWRMRLPVRSRNSDRHCIANDGDGLSMGSTLP